MTRARHVRMLVAVAVALAAPVALAAAPARAADKKGGVAFDFQDVELSVVARFVSEVTGRNFILDDRVRGRITIISPSPVSPDDAYGAFQAALAVKGLTTVESRSFVKIVPMREARGAPAGAGGPDDVVTRILPVHHADVSTLEPVLAPLVSPEGVLTVHPDSSQVVVVDTAANTDRIAALVEALDRPGRHETTKLIVLQHATANDLATGLRAALDGDAITFVADPRANALLLSGPPDTVARASHMVATLDAGHGPGGRDLYVYRLQHGSAQHLVEVLAGILGLPTSEADEHQEDLPATGRPPQRPGRTEDQPAKRRPLSTGSGPALVLGGPVRVTADPATNALLVSATHRDWTTIERVIRDLDVARRQVFVEAIILEATADKTRTLGIDLRSAGTLGHVAGLAQANLGSLAAATTDPTSVPGLILAAASNETVKLADGSVVPAHAVLLSALDAESDVDVLSAPTIVTTDNEEAEIVVGRNVPFVASRATDATNLENLFTTIERRDVGITLRMTPQILADDYVRLTLFEEVSDIDETETAALGDPTLVGPTTTVRSTATVIAARNGQTVVIGGLLADTLRGMDRSVPFVSRIPVLGQFFRHESRRRVKTNLLVFLTPHVINSDVAFASRSAAERAAFPHGTPHQGVLHGPSWAAPPAPEGR
jgi:general secretion pathway protein D